MKKIKEIWQNNKIFILLGIILVACLVAIIVVMLTYFFGGSDSVYGDRLSGQENYEFTSKIEDNYISFFNEKENVIDVSINVNGKILYIHINYNIDTSLEDAKNIASSSLESLDEKMKEFYDVNFVLKSESSDEKEGFTILGAKNIVASYVTWNNNTPVVEDEGE